MKDNFALVGQYSHIHEAYLVKSFLASHGIESEIYDEHVVSMDWFYSNAIGGVKLVVASSEAERAKELLKDAEKPKTLEDLEDLQGQSCPVCNSTRTEILSQFSRGWALLAVALLAIPLPFLLYDRWVCRQCGHQWKESTHRSWVFKLAHYLVLFLVVALIVTWLQHSSYFSR